MAAARRYAGADSEYSCSDSDYDVSDYDDFVVPVHKKGQGRRGGAPAANVQPKSRSAAAAPKPHVAQKGAAGRSQEPAAKGVAGQPGARTTSSVVAGAKPVQSQAKPGSGNAPVRSNKGASAQGERGSFPVLNVVVCGRVDVGKSTLLGHLLTLLGAVESRSLRGEFAWILDQGEDERSRGITIDPTKASAVVDVVPPPEADGSGSRDGTVRQSAPAPGTDAVAPVPAPSTNRRVKLNFIDTPGHHELVSSLVRGAIFAEAAVVIVDVLDFLKEDTNGYFEQHFFLLWSLGVRHFVICVNKVDRCAERESVEKAMRMARERVSSYALSTLLVVPTSGMSGLNLVHRDSGWGDGPSVVDALRGIAQKTAFSDESACISPERQIPSGATLCHIFDMWEMSKTNVGCACFLETALNTPCKLVALPSRSAVTCSEVSCLVPASEGALSTAKSGSNADELTARLGLMSLSATPSASRRDFADSMTLRGQEIQALTGDRLLVDTATLEHLKAGSGNLAEMPILVCHVLVHRGSSHKLTLGFGVTAFVGYFQSNGGISGVWERVGAGKWKRVTSLWPGKEGVLVLQLSAPLFAQPVPLSAAEALVPRKAPQASGGEPRGPPSQHNAPRLSLLSRVLLKAGGDVVAGGTIVDNPPK
ncbi:elongation factor Tu GTP binding domain containing protein, putative [Babesia bigemina]|uniref:Elongation factor Tu GTP binding domain containing protein, putative n=1 Tax=Babesia bigemina TaxID=5866 RepID=A0A061D819_BABBI|nr:elongation factor Tu GTP binding domain containing protein, putative [Babesia bigemina]CDR96801.1 elongation factor Tu GTP binding domain containing protein, putative [Babesia bigemina]|eukprot:XP_012768987.1 elongation factor Tu GTP binding domain containing protein, putative [Babesia bigemina]